MIALLQFDVLPTHHVPSPWLLHVMRSHTDMTLMLYLHLLMSIIRIYKANPHSLIFKWKWLPVKCFLECQIEDNFNSTPNG